ncbi:MAG: YggS family pyridoxal phosphate-dependent enzyme [Puniceicoccales bacterium]
MISYNEFFENFSNLRKRISEEASRHGRDADEIRILPVTKTHPKDAVEYAARAGLASVGENRVQEAVEKSSLLPDVGLKWELIGHLQSNKSALAVNTFDRIQSVDSGKIARKLDRFAGEAGRMLPCLIQVNTGEDPRKFGFLVEEMERELEGLLALENLEIEGLMTIAPLEGGTDAARRAFARLRELAESLRERSGRDLPELSMGMTGDLAEAIAEGSTMIRVGSGLFGARE